MIRQETVHCSTVVGPVKAGISTPYIVTPTFYFVAASEFL
jgi:hypothetical protein